MTIKQTFFAVISVAFMMTTGLVIGIPYTPEELRAIIKNYELSVKKYAKNIKDIDEYEKQVHLFNAKVSQLKIDILMEHIHANDYR